MCSLLSMKKLPEETSSERFCRRLTIVTAIAATGLFIIFVATQRLESFVLAIFLYATSAIAYQLTRQAKWNRLRRFVYRRSGYACEKCGVSGVRLVAHHRIPRSQGGADSPENLMCLCENCHTEIHPWLSGTRKYLGPMRLQKTTQLDVDYWDKRLGLCAVCGKKIRGNAERLPDGRWKHHPRCP